MVSIVASVMNSDVFDIRCVSPISIVAPVCNVFFEYVSHIITSFLLKKGT